VHTGLSAVREPTDIWLAHLDQHYEDLYRQDRLVVQSQEKSGLAAMIYNCQQMLKINLGNSSPIQPIFGWAALELGFLTLYHTAGLDDQSAIVKL